MTLLEVLLAIALSSIFFCMLFPTLGTLQRVVLQAEAKEMMEMDMRGALYFIEDEIRLSNKVCIQLEGDRLTTEDDVYLCKLYAEHVHPVGEMIPEDFNKQDENQVKKIVFYDGTVDKSGKPTKKTLQVTNKKIGNDRTYTLSYQSQVLVEGMKGITISEQASQLVLVLSSDTAEGEEVSMQLIPNLEYKR